VEERVFDWVARVIGVCRPVRNMRVVLRARFIINERNQTPMNKIVHHVGLDVHKESIAVSIAPAHSTEARRYGIISGSLDAVDTSGV
jgi:phosphatidate phosphatase APP1